MSNESWKSMFENWPEAIAKEGLLVTNFQEQIAFVNFLVSGDILLVERDRPDSYGARKVMLTYDSISALKITNPMELARFQVMGFQPPF
ncbi:hypothetical protein Pla110_33550 [Polystyrenella longa]|uniref:Uncharacterized protein n=1 Tax=Polystyrenella longa TaxID=2528007 RepID=A0A518CQW9_9PLAN|nr:hypothetical protein [Polystyrenella longa]QDU81613.1 hypothetical protein Pla110_33550 [Polystyrenella longa]